MKSLKSFGDLVPTEDMAVRHLCFTMIRWALSDNYRAVKSKSGQLVHKRFTGHTLRELEEKVDSLGPRWSAEIRKTPVYKACVTYLCPDEDRPGKMVA